MTTPENVMSILQAAKRESKEIEKEGKLLEATIEFNRWLSSLTTLITTTPTTITTTSRPSTTPQQSTDSTTSHEGNSDKRDDAQKEADKNQIVAANTAMPGKRDLTDVKTSVTMSFDKLEENINQNIGKHTFLMFEKAKELLNSKLLLLLGAGQLARNGFLTLATENNKNHIPKLLNAFFIEFEAGEKQKLEESIFDQHPISRQLFKSFVERDSKFVNGEGISVYALLYLFNLNRDAVIGSDKPLKEQLVINKPIFGKNKQDGALLNDDNLKIIINILKKIMINLGKISGIYEIYNGDKTREDFQKVRDAYHNVVSENKSVIALLKRRDDWNNATTKAPDKFHYRFSLTQDGNPSVGENSRTQALKLSYNDSPMRLPWSKSTRDMSVVEGSYSHKYKMYGFDAIYGAATPNNGIADKFHSKFLKKMMNNSSGDTLEPLCFIGYGQSGSGKTSTLIYLDIFKQDGILVEIIKKLNPDTVTSSMIEIYEGDSAKASDESCVGIGTKDYARDVDGDGSIDEKDKRPGEIVKCPPKKREIIDVPEPVDKHSNGTTPVMRMVTIGEILDKRADDKKKVRTKFVPAVAKESRMDHRGGQRGGAALTVDSNKDSLTKVTFTKTPNGGAWKYTHNDTGSGIESVDLNYDVKQYVMDAFECREIGPTSNNKQSSRSHVVVCLILEGIMVKGKDGKTKPMKQVIYVCDLAGVENVFDCTPGSEDSIRMMAKILANKNYHLHKDDEGWGQKLNKKRPNNIVKYVHEKIHINTTQDPEDAYVKDPNCWPDGSPNPKGDLDEIAQGFAREFIVKWYKGLKGEKGGLSSAEDAIEFYTEKLSTLPVVPKSAETIRPGIERFYKASRSTKIPGFLNVTISDFFHNNEQNAIGYVEKQNWMATPSKIKREGGVDVAGGQPYFTFPSLSTVPEIDSAMKNFNKDSVDKISSSMKKLRGTNVLKREDNTFQAKWGYGANYPLSAGFIDGQPKEIMKTIRTFFPLANKIFAGLEAPDCVLAYVDGIKEACTIRRKEGYVINNTLSQLIKDLRFVMKDSIKSKLEKGGDNLPCIFADMFDEYSEYQILDPLIDWYDVTNEQEKNADVGTILTAMCILGNPGTRARDIKKGDKVDFLKKFKFVMTTVINESFIMNFGGKNASTPAGNLIYVNNPPLPPYINVSILEKALKKYIFYKYDTRDEDDETDSPEGELLRKKCVLSFFDAYFNLIIKMFTHPLYQLDAMTHLLLFKGFKDRGKYVFIDFESQDEFYKNWNNTMRGALKIQLNKIDDSVKILLKKIKGNNSATYVGTMQTTEEVNRVSSKLMLSEPVNKEAGYHAIDVDENNINNTLLKQIFKILTTTREGRASQLADFELTNVARKPLTDAQIYEILYAVNVADGQHNPPLPKRSLTLKEIDINSILVSLEAVFPKAITYIDYKKLQHLWEKTTNITRAEFVLKDDTTKEKKSYPYLRDKFSKTVVDDDELDNIFQADNKRTTGVTSNTKVKDILTLNAKIKEYGALEPSPKHMGEDEIAYVNEQKASDWAGEMSGGGKKRRFSCAKHDMCNGRLDKALWNAIAENQAKCPLCKGEVEGWSRRADYSEANAEKYSRRRGPWAKHIATSKHIDAVEKAEKKAAMAAAKAEKAAAAANFAAHPQIPSIKWFRENSKVKQPFFSIFRHILRDDFIDLYRKDYLMEMVKLTGRPEANGWFKGHSEPKPASYKNKIFPELLENKLVEDYSTWEPQSVDILNRNHRYIFLEKNEQVKEVKNGWSILENQGGGYKKKKSRRRQTKRNKKSKKRNTRKR